MSGDDDSAILHLMRAASAICDVRFYAETSANNLLLAIVAKRIRNLLDFQKMTILAEGCILTQGWARQAKDSVRLCSYWRESVKGPIPWETYGQLKKLWASRRNQQTTSTIHIRDVQSMKRKRDTKLWVHRRYCSLWRGRETQSYECSYLVQNRSLTRSWCK